MIWALTSYFNPVRFGRRYENFTAFREALEIPLLTVEWSPDGRFELDESDSDQLVRLSGGDLMWQKERLLNVGLASLPRACDAVAWLDADVIFDDPHWASRLEDALDESPIVQLFSHVKHDAPNAHEPPVLQRESLASLFERAGRAAVAKHFEGATDAAPATDASLRLSDAEMERFELGRLASRPTSGHAWAARRDLLDKFGLYDACICGSGDMAIALAALGLQESFASAFRLNPSQAAHYRAWAEPFSRATGARTRVLSSELRHLFHGSLSRRQYRARLDWLAASGFDPYSDLAFDDQGLWQWQIPHADRDAWFGNYFAQRCEDGDGRHTGAAERSA